MFVRLCFKARVQFEFEFKFDRLFASQRSSQFRLEELSKRHLPNRLRPFMACAVGPLLVASTLGYLVVAAIVTISVTSNQTQSGAAIHLQD